MKDNLKYWLALNKLPNVGPATIKKLYDHFGSVDAIWNAEIRDLIVVEGFGKLAYESFSSTRPSVNPEKELQMLLGKNLNVLTFDDIAYPDLLKNIYDPPSILYFKGNPDVLSKRSIAIVGTRKPTSYGVATAERFAKELASLGFVIVSGFAYGIDTTAHRGALQAGGETVAVFGCGLDVIYPAENICLAEEIEDSGCMISEFPPGTQTSTWTFPQRNRIISGLTLGTIVVEGTQDSGSLITAKSALEQGREVFAVPGAVESENSRGPHWLIKQGAKLVESVEDILDELNIFIPKEHLNKDKVEKDLSGLSEREKQIYDILKQGALQIDSFSEKTNLPQQDVSSILMMLEIKGFIKQFPGKVFAAAG